VDLTDSLRGDELLDMDRALEYVQGDEEFLKEILQIFLEEIPQRVDSFQAAIADNDMKKMANLAHSLKGSAMAIGAAECHNLAKNVEEAAGNENKTETLTQYSLLEQNLEGLRNLLDQMDL